MIASRSSGGEALAFWGSGAWSPENFENRDCQIRIFLMFLVNNYSRLNPRKIGLKYVQSFLCSEGKRQGNDLFNKNNALINTDISVWITACPGRANEKGQKTQKKLFSTEEQRKQAKRRFKNRVFGR